MNPGVIQDVELPIRGRVRDGSENHERPFRHGDTLDEGHADGQVRVVIVCRLEMSGRDAGLVLDAGALEVAQDLGRVGHDRLQDVRQFVGSLFSLATKRFVELLPDCRRGRSC